VRSRRAMLQAPWSRPSLQSRKACASSPTRSSPRAIESRERKPQLLELVLSKRQLRAQEELVELRWRDLRAGEHGVRLPAMMDLMLEEVKEHVTRRLHLHVLGSFDVHVN